MNEICDIGSRYWKHIVWRTFSRIVGEIVCEICVVDILKQTVWIIIKANIEIVWEIKSRIIITVGTRQH
jgi:hypothetical protein